MRNQKEIVHYSSLKQDRTSNYKKGKLSGDINKTVDNREIKRKGIENRNLLKIVLW